MAREKVTFEMNETQIVQLEFNDGIEVPGRSGAQWQYFLHDDKIMWVDPEVRTKIQAIGARACSEIAITKVKKGKAAAWWTVEQVQDETGGDHDEEGQREESQAEWNARIAREQAEREQANRATVAKHHSNGAVPAPVNGTAAATADDFDRARAIVQSIEDKHRKPNGAAVPQPQPAPAPKPAPAKPAAHSIATATAKLAAALMAAIDAGAEAMVYAKRKNIFPEVEFDASDYRAMANTIMINAEKGQ